MVSRLDNIAPVPDVFDRGASVRLNETEYNALLLDTLVTPAQQRPFPNGHEIEAFFPLVQNAIVSRQRSEGVPEDRMIQIFEEDPPETVDTEMITFALEVRTPGQMNRGPAGDNRIKEVVPHFRSSGEHPEHPGEKLISMGKFYDNWLNFYIYARTNKVAMARLIWFEKMMDGFNWYFRQNGFRVVEEGCTIGRQRPELDGLTVTRYPVSYLVRTDDTFHYAEQELKFLMLDVSVQSG